MINTSPNTNACIFNVKLFKEIIEKIKYGNKTLKKEEIKKLLLMDGLINHHQDKVSKRVVLAACKKFEYPQEQHTCKKLTEVNYDVIVVPKGYFKRDEKKFDVFISREHVFFEADLKCITTSNPDTIGKRIKEGSEQAARIVLDITSAIQKKELVVGLKTGCERNPVLKEILLFYNSLFYCLPKTQILSKNIFSVIK